MTDFQKIMWKTHRAKTGGGAQKRSGENSLSSAGVRL
jgi:hypothetical protein